MTGLETLRKELEGFGHDVSLAVGADGNLDIKTLSTVGAPHDVPLLQELLRRLGLPSRKVEKKETFIKGETRATFKSDDIEVQGPWAKCKIVGYTKKVIPAKAEEIIPERIVPAEEEKEIEVPIFDCTGRLEAVPSGAVSE